MKAAKRIFVIIIVWFSLHMACTVVDGLIDRGEPADIALIMGTQVNRDGTLSMRLQKRLDCGLELYESGRVKRFIVSGGLGKEGFNEGDKMKEYMLQHAIPDSCIVVDNNGNNSRQSIQNAVLLRSALHFDKVIIVSQYYHLTRCKMLARKLGLNNVSSASPMYFELRDIYSLLREFFAYYSQLI